MDTIDFPDSPWSRHLPSPEEMVAYDNGTISTGISSLDLMEGAGDAIFSELKERFSFELYSQGTITILCGPGNNGGDGLVVARLLSEHGYAVSVIQAWSDKRSDDNISEGDAFRDKGGVIRYFGKGTPSEEAIPLEEFKEAIKSPTLLIDALLGTGQKESPRGSIAEIISLVNEVLSQAENKPRVVSVDIPSGVNGETGAVYEPSIHADLTISIELIKRGLVQYPAKSVCGSIAAVTIGIDCSEPCEFHLVDGANVPKLPRRSPDSHKGRFGRVLVVGGCENMPGAPILAASAALRCGAGLVTVVIGRAWAKPSFPAELLLKVVDTGSSYSQNDLDVIIPLLDTTDVLILGPGIGMERDTGAFIEGLLKEVTTRNIPCIVDADGLNHIAEQRKAGKKFDLPTCVLTPHPGEMARLIGCTSEEIQLDRYSAVRKLSVETNSTVILKGASSITYHSGRGFVNTTGNPGMATPGSGDVLAGIIGSLIGQKLSLIEAAILGTFLHGKAGDVAFEKIRSPLVASDIIQALPEALSTLVR